MDTAKRETKKEKEQREAIESLRECFKPGDTVYCILRHVTRSGMQRSISPIYFVNGNPIQPRYPWYSVCKALGWTPDNERDAVKVDGAGMDMGFHLVYSLAATLYGDGYALTHRWL